jgi:predicted DNA-binding transcriptional regulator YafY
VRSRTPGTAHRPPPIYSKKKRNYHEGHEEHEDDKETEEIKRWILSFGMHATVLEPPHLREDMAMELKAILGKYESSETSLAEGDEP